MATTVTKTIGGTTPDYTTIALWEDGEDDTSLVTADEIRVGACRNALFSAAGNVATIAGATTDSTRYRVLSTDTGASFRDNASVQTNALRYNESNGAAIKTTAGYSQAIVSSENNFRLQNLQLAGTNASHSRGLEVGSGNAVYVDNCIIEGKSSAHALIYTPGTGSFIRNTLIVQRTSGASRIVDMQYGAVTCVNVTFAVPSDLTAATDAIRTTGGGSLVFKNCAFFGASNVASTAQPTFTTCYADDATPPTGATTATYANQFQATTDGSHDYRLKTGADCIDTGTTDSTNAANDIAGTARPSGSAYDVGCWELVSGGGGSPATSALLLLCGSNLAGNFR